MKKFSNANTSVACFVKRFLLTRGYAYQRIYRERREHAGVAGATIKFFQVRYKDRQDMYPEDLLDLHYALGKLKCVPKLTYSGCGPYKNPCPSLTIQEIK